MGRTCRRAWVSYPTAQPAAEPAHDSSATNPPPHRTQLPLSFRAQAKNLKPVHHTRLTSPNHPPIGRLSGRPNWLPDERVAVLCSDGWRVGVLFPSSCRAVLAPERSEGKVPLPKFGESAGVGN